MNVEVGTETAQFPEKEYINGIFVAVYDLLEYFFAYFFVFQVCTCSADLCNSSPPLLISLWSLMGIILTLSMVLWPLWSLHPHPSLMCACDPDILACLMTFLILPSSSLNERFVMTFWFVVWPFGSCWGKWSKPLGLFYDPSFLITDRSGDQDLLFF